MTDDIKIGTQCVHVSAIWKFNNHMGNKVTHASKRRTFAFRLHSFWVSLWTLESQVQE